VLFNSYVFILAFLPVTLLGYFFLSARFAPHVAKAWLVAASLFYYAWWNPAYLGLLLASMLVNYGLGLALGKGGQNRGLLAFGVVLNLGALAWFKYANFFVDNLNSIAGTSLHLEHIILPLAISFFTFQQIAFLIDAARGETREYSFLDYALFVSFFPQLIAGPIVHHKEMMPQFARESTFRFNPDHFAVGLALFTFGLFKKVIIADSVGPYASRVFDPVAETGLVPMTADAWGAALAYTFQLYFDFSGYSDMAIGLAHMFGIRLPMNFNSPYMAHSIIEFWRRWHITLSRFLRDYLYIPLGGNRKGPGRRLANIMATMTLGGLWHGAGWTFVAWGAFHGILLSINHLFGGGAASVVGWWKKIWAVPLTFLVVVIGWVLFRSADLDTAWRMFMAMIGAESPGLGPLLKSRNFISFAILLALVWFVPNTRRMLADWDPNCEPIKPGETLHGRMRVFAWQPTTTWALITGLIFAVCVLSLSKVSEFLYFQF